MPYHDHLLNPQKGTYLLVLEANTINTIQIGKIGSMQVNRGFYYYVGSAFGPGGLRARVGRHLKTVKNTRWHIDYLRGVTNISEVWISEDPLHLEAVWVKRLERQKALIRPMDRFGSSDSRSRSHLFYSTKAISESQIRSTLKANHLQRI